MPINRKSRVLALLSILAMFSLQAAATNLRGRVDGVHPYAPNPFPLGGARVALYISTPKGPVLVKHAFTGGDGMYYLPGINPGAYTLRINGRLNFPLRVNPQPYQDIPPILLR